MNIIAFPIQRVPRVASAARPRKHRAPSNPVGKSYSPDAGWHRLTRHQKTKLVLLSESAARKAGVPRGEVDAWRREEAIRACGLRISEATQAHWGDLLAHFQMLNGQVGRALDTAMRVQDNPHRIAMHKLAAELAKDGHDVSYAEAICSRKCKCPLRDASASQVWGIIFDLRSRRSGKAKGGTK